MYPFSRIKSEQRCYPIHRDQSTNLEKSENIPNTLSEK